MPAMEHKKWSLETMPTNQRFVRALMLPKLKPEKAVLKSRSGPCLAIRAVFAPILGQTERRFFDDSPCSTGLANGSVQSMTLKNGRKNAYFFSSAKTPRGVRFRT